MSSSSVPDALPAWSSSPERAAYRNDGYRRATKRGVAAIAVTLAGGAWVGFAPGGGRQAVPGYVALLTAVGILIWATVPYMNARQSFLRNSQTRSINQARAVGAGMVTWSTSLERQMYIEQERQRSARRGFQAFGLALFSSAWLSLDPSVIPGIRGQTGHVMLGVTGLVLALCLAMWALTPFWAARRSYIERVQAEKAAAVEEALKQLIGNADDPNNVLPLTSLFIFNRRQLDEYQTLTKRQALVTFRNAQYAAAIGLVVLVIGAVLVLEQGSSSGRYTVGGLSGIGSLMSLYLSRTFFIAHRDAMRQLAKYYEEPFLTSRALSAERVITRNTAVGNVGDYLAALVQRLLDPASLISDAQGTPLNHLPVGARGNDSPASNEGPGVVATAGGAAPNENQPATRRHRLLRWLT